MVVSASVEPSDQIGQFNIQVVEQFLNGLNQLLQVALGLKVDLGVVQDEVRPMRVLDFSQNLLFAVCEDVALDVNSENTHDHTCN